MFATRSTFFKEMSKNAAINEEQLGLKFPNSVNEKLDNIHDFDLHLSPKNFLADWRYW